jgi:hypothetical protein
MEVGIVSEARVGPQAPGSSPPLSSSARQRRRWLLFIGAMLTILLVTAFLLATTDDRGSTSAVNRMGHVHGLGVDPSDGALYAGTHYGVYRIAEGEPAERVGDLVQDFMGFTVMGPERFLASGHPAEGADGPSSVGLLESEDAGLTWQTRSLAGEADFHALQVRHGRVYGLNSLSGALMVSEDRTTWETLSREPLVDVAVSPTDPDLLLGTSEQGLKRSTDGGRSFRTVEDAPLLQLVTWAPDGSLFGAGPDGALFAGDGGRTWDERGSLGDTPEALTAISEESVYAAVPGAVLASNDGARTFEARHEE